MADASTSPQDSPYSGLDDRAFWRAGVVDAGAYPPPNIYRPKYAITKKLPIFTAGSCFAQHVGRTLAQSGYNVIDAEPIPADIPTQVAQRHGYALYSARYANIYTVRQFLQLLQEAFGDFTPTHPVWEKDGRFYDALRPGVTPGGLDTADQVAQARVQHLEAVRTAVTQSGMVVFTLGLTETWAHTQSGTIYPTAPGTIAGQFDADAFNFVNFRAAAIRDDFLSVRKIFHATNPDIKFLLTVSPVPLTATASGDHVLSASSYSKAVLRTVAGELAQDFADIDYFPSYEIVSSHPSAGRMFEANMRSVKPRGVLKVMRAFLEAHAPNDATADKAARRARRAARRKRMLEQGSTAPKNDVICEEELLDAFRK